MHLSVISKFFAAVGIIACLSTASVAQDTGWQTISDNEYHILTYESAVSIDSGLYKYDYSLENDSLRFDIVSWTWENDGTVYNVMPNPNAVIDEQSNDWPLAYNQTGDIYSYSWREEYSSDSKAPIQVTSSITYSDNFIHNVPIFVPTPAAAVPEPSTAIVMLTALAGFAIRRKR